MSGNGKGMNSPKAKKYVNLAYGIGAALVIIGALLKLMHWPGWKTMLPIGMGAEAILFTIGAFEPPHHEGSKWDWSAVFPQLTKEKSPSEILEEQKLRKKGKLPEAEADPAGEVVAPVMPAMPGFTSSQAQAAENVALGLSEDDIEKWNETISKISSTADNLSKLSDAGDVSESYINKLATAGDAVDTLSKAQEASADIISSSSELMAENFKTTSEKMDLSISAASDVLKDGLSTVTDKFDSNMEEASITIKDELSKASTNAAAKIENSTSGLSDIFENSAKGFEQTFAKAYNESANVMTDANQALAQGYQKVTEALGAKLKMIEGATSETGNELQSVSKNLSAINSVYELQLKAINDELAIKEAQAATQTSTTEQLALIQKALSEAVSTSNAYKAESEKMSKTISELNAVYGNMLSSLNA